MTTTHKIVRSCSVYISHETLDPQAISAELGVTADKAFKKGDLHQVNCKATAYPHGVWVVESAQHVRSDSLEHHLRFIADFARQKASVLQRISASGYPVRARVYWDLGDDVLSAALDPDDLAAVCRVVSSIDLSVV
ncbi:DUF4279 domain-containing protein [Bradyrhizobium erythrophlei]|uniref:DUF4279 domain-containing protein n=1 Tax=Bradyrhizobium erythrophlei TaxID=1437360 RepID=UPI0035EDBCB2